MYINLNKCKQKKQPHKFGNQKINTPQKGI